MAPTKKPPQQQQSILSFFSSKGLSKSKPARDNEEVITEKLAVKEKSKVISVKQKSSSCAVSSKTTILSSRPSVPASQVKTKETDDSKMDTDSDDDTPMAKGLVDKRMLLVVNRIIDMSFVLNRVEVENVLVIRICPRAMRKQKPKRSLPQVKRQWLLNNKHLI
jgi:hypothetical protein